MNIKQGQSLMDEINQFIDVGDYFKAEEKAKTLLQMAEKKGWQDLLISALSFRLAFAIENDNLEEGEKLAARLAKQPPTDYSIFLQARLLMKQGKNHESLEKGREALAFAQKHSDTTQRAILEKIYNLNPNQHKSHYYCL